MSFGELVPFSKSVRFNLIPGRHPARTAHPSPAPASSRARQWGRCQSRGSTHAEGLGASLRESEGAHGGIRRLSKSAYPQTFLVQSSVAVSTHATLSSRLPGRIRRY